MFKYSLIVVIVLVVGCASSYGNKSTRPESTETVDPAIKNRGTSWVDNTTPIFLIENVHRQAEAWAICAASWELASNLMAQDSPAKSKQFSETANGAKIAVAMTYVGVMTINKDADLTVLKNQFNSTWNFAKIAMKNMPESQLTRIMANIESSDDVSWLHNHMATLYVCEQNMDAQQHYIDTWRDLAKSGLLVFPGD